jgi:hypothetical protein
VKVRKFKYFSPFFFIAVTIAGAEPHVNVQHLQKEWLLPSVVPGVLCTKEGSLAVELLNSFLIFYGQGEVWLGPQSVEAPRKVRCF